MRSDPSSDLKELLDQSFSGAASGCVSRDGQVVSAYGETLIYPIYSITKSYLACLILMAQSSGLLNLDDPLADYLPDLDVPDASNMSLRQLLNHTAGLPDYGALAEYGRAIRSGSEPWDDETFALHTYRKGLKHPPGNQFAYSNPGYALIVKILENLHGADLNALLQNQICKPLGLTNTRVLDSLGVPDVVQSVSSGLSSDGRTVDVASHYPVAWVWHRVIGSNSLEVCRFFHALFSGALLPADQIAQMTRTVTVEEPNSGWTSPSYGLGLMHDRKGPDGPAFGHNGGGPGYSSSAFYFLQTSTCVCILTRQENADLCYANVLRVIEAESLSR